MYWASVILLREISLKLINESGKSAVVLATALDQRRGDIQSSSASDGESPPPPSHLASPPPLLWERRNEQILVWGVGYGVHGSGYSNGDGDGVGGWC